jgi:hypothetical protein
MPPETTEPAELAQPQSPPMKFESRDDIPLSDLLLDPNNYRFLDNKDYKPKPKNRYASDKVQNATLRLLAQDKRYQLDELKKSIITNGYVPMERIIVAPYDSQPDKFLVIEGNRRVAALKSLLQEHDEGVRELTEDQITSFSNIPCAILKVEESQRTHAARVIMGIRHITGPREWGAYQQAQLIQQLHNEEGQEFSSIADHLGLSTVEVSRRYRAMNALKAMENDELYSEKAEPEYYRLFHELVSLPEVRTRFGWDSETDQFTNIDRAREFFELIAPQTKEATEAKLKSYSDVRKLKTIITNPAAEEILLDPAKSFTDALAEVSQHRPPVPPQKSAFSDFLIATLARVQQMTREELKALTPKDKKQIKKLIAELKEVLGK